MFSGFVKKAVEQDSRNVFKKCRGDVSFVPTVFRAFYKDFDPVDVEVKIDNSYYHFLPVKDLESLQKEYNLGDECFVFATCNGEPIYIREGKIYTCLFGKTRVIEHEIAESLEMFLGMIS